MSKERTDLPDKGPLHAVMVTLMEGKQVGFLTSMEDLRKAIAAEHGDNHVVVSDNTVWNAVSNVRKILHEYEVDIFHEFGVGYELVGIDEMSEKSQRGLPNNGPEHDALIALFNAKKAGFVAPKEYLRDAMIEGYNEKHNTNIQFYTEEQLGKTLFRLRKAIKGTGYRIINRFNIGYEILSPEEVENVQ